MSINISESPGVEQFKSAWANMVQAIQPDVDMLPAPWDTVFSGPIKLLMSSTLALGIIPERRMYPMIEKINFIYSLLKYPDFVNYDLNYVAIHIGELFSMLELGMGINGKFLLEGPMSRQFVSQTSRHIGGLPVSQGGSYRPSMEEYR